jgi:hypothetical protein
MSCYCLLCSEFLLGKMKKFGGGSCDSYTYTNVFSATELNT